MEDRNKATRQDIRVVRRDTHPYSFINDQRTKVTVPDLKVSKDKKDLKIDGTYRIINIE
ncbi:MAG TPA: hypothetical protein VM577_18885 [Anaerovoracaceae bacterium]|nr:hypothetical protein [Anaerovoracaceae bacterium]